MGLSKEDLAEVCDMVAGMWEKKLSGSTSEQYRSEAAALREEAEKEKPDLSGAVNRFVRCVEKAVGISDPSVMIGTDNTFTFGDFKTIAAALRKGEEWERLCKLRGEDIDRLRNLNSALESEKAKGWGCKMSPQGIVDAMKVMLEARLKGLNATAAGYSIRLREAGLNV